MNRHFPVKTYGWPMKGCSILIRKVKQKPQCDHFILVGKAIVEKTVITSTGRGGEKQCLCLTGGNISGTVSTGKTTQFSKLKNRTVIWFSNFTSVYLSKGTKRLTWKDTYIPMFTEALFSTPEIWKQPKCPTKDKMNKNDMVYIYKEYYFSHNKKMKSCYLGQHGWI